MTKNVTMLEKGSEREMINISDYCPHNGTSWAQTNMPYEKPGKRVGKSRCRPMFGISLRIKTKWVVGNCEVKV